MKKKKILLPKTNLVPPGQQTGFLHLLKDTPSHFTRRCVRDLPDRRNLWIREAYILKRYFPLQVINSGILLPPFAIRHFCLDDLKNVGGCLLCHVHIAHKAQNGSQRIRNERHAQKRLDHHSWRERVSIQLAKVNTGQNKNSEGNVLEVDDKAVENASLEALGNGPGFGELQPPFERIDQLLLEPE